MIGRIPNIYIYIYIYKLLLQSNTHLRFDNVLYIMYVMNTCIIMWSCFHSDYRLGRTTVYLLSRSVSFASHTFISGDFAVICKLMKYSDAFLVFI